MMIAMTVGWSVRGPSALSLVCLSVVLDESRRTGSKATDRPSIISRTTLTGDFMARHSKQRLSQ